MTMGVNSLWQYQFWNHYVKQVVETAKEKLGGVFVLGITGLDWDWIEHELIVIIKLVICCLDNKRFPFLSCKN